MVTSANVEVVIGSILGDTYEIVRVLGEGGMGAVWEANHLRLPGKRFAVKVLHGNAAADREAYARFRREAEIASRIGHPNIIEVLDWNTLPSGSPYLVLEYLDGEDLAARLSRGPIPVPQALSIARQIASALKAAHAAQVVHRDLKPGNIYLVSREVDGTMVDHVKVLDFGISKIKNSQTVQTQDATLLGTPQYMAPEQALGKNTEIDARTDIFALGAIVYEMISGKPPFVGSTLAEVVFKVVYEPVVPLATLVPGVPQEISDAIDRAMQKSAAERFPDVSSFIQAATGRGLATTADRQAVSGSSAQVVVPPTYDRTSREPNTEDPRSHLRGEMQVRPPEQSSRKWAFLVGAIIIGAAGAFGAVQLIGRTSPPVALQQPTPPKPLPPAGDPVKVDAPKGDAPKVDAPKMDPKTPDTPTAEAPVTKKTHDPKPEKPEKIETISPEAKALLDEADKQLQSGDRDGARHTAQRSLNVQKTSRGFAIVTRAYCDEGSLGNANAWFHNVGAADRARVRKDCKAHGLDLQ